MSKQYVKKCSSCQTEIIMSDVSGKWKALETDNATLHICKSSKNNNDRPPTRPPMQEQQQQPTVSVNKDYEIAELKKRVTAMESWIKRLSESYVMNH